MDRIGRAADNREDWRCSAAEMVPQKLPIARSRNYDVYVRRRSEECVRAIFQYENQR